MRHHVRISALVWVEYNFYYFPRYFLVYMTTDWSCTYWATGEDLWAATSSGENSVWCSNFSVCPGLAVTILEAGIQHNTSLALTIRLILFNTSHSGIISRHFAVTPLFWHCLPTTNTAILIYLDKEQFISTRQDWPSLTTQLFILEFSTWQIWSPIEVVGLDHFCRWYNLDLSCYLYSCTVVIVIKQ